MKEDIKDSTIFFCLNFYKIILAEFLSTVQVFDCMNMKNLAVLDGTSEYVHHYKALAEQNENPTTSKIIRLAQELADSSNKLPYENSNIYKFIYLTRLTIKI